MDTALPLPLGMDDRDSLAAEATRSPDVRNVRSVRERWQRAPGTVPFGSGAIVGRPRNLLQVFEGSVSLTERVLLFTSQRLYDLDTATMTWNAVNAGLGEPDAGTPITFGGSDLLRFSVVHTLGSVFFTRGGSEIFTYNGGFVNRFSTLLYPPSSLTKFGAYMLLPFNDRVVAVRTIEDSGAGGVDRRIRVRWHISGNPTDWDGAGSGFLEVGETSSAPLVGAAVLGDRAYLFKERQIVELIATGSLPIVFRQEARVHGTGLVARHSWAATENVGFFVGPDDVYAWDGTTLTPVGTPIYKTLTARIDYASTANFIGPDRVQGIINPHDAEYWIVVEGAAAPNTFIYDFRRSRWYTDHTPAMTMLGFLRVGGTLVTDPGDIDRSGFMATGFADAVPERYTDASAVRRGAAFSAYVTTRDIPAQSLRGAAPLLRTPSPSLGQRNTLWEVRFLANPGEAYNVAVSTDEGVTWLDEQTITTDGAGVGRAFFLLAYSFVRFRVLATDGAPFTLRGPLSYRWTESGQLT